MSFVGIVSLPVLLLSIIFIFFHTKFIGLYNNCLNNRSSLIELMLHKYELLLFFSQDIVESKTVIGTETNLKQNIAKLEDLLINFDFSDEDTYELSEITNEIEKAENMYNQAKEEFVSFTNNYPGKFFVTFLMDKSMKL